MKKPINLYLTSLEAVANQFKNFFPDKVTRVVDVANGSHMRQVILKYKEITFPYFALQITTSSINHDGAVPAKNLQRVGAVGSLNSNKTARMIFHVVPVVTGMRVVFVTNTVKELYDFIQRWHIATVTNELDLSLEADNFNVVIKVGLDDSLTVPELENEDIGEIFILETSINIETYLGEVEQVSIVNTIKQTLSVAGTKENVLVRSNTLTQTSDLNSTTVSSTP